MKSGVLAIFRVCYVVDSRYPGGAERYISLILDGIDRTMFSPSVVARLGGRLGPWCDRQRAKGILVTEIPMDLPFRPGHAPGIFRAIRRCAPHVLHVNIPGPYDGQMGLVAPLARLAGAGVVIVTEHLPMVEKLWKRALVKRVSYHQVDTVLTICEANVSYLENMQGVPLHKIRVIHNGIPQGYGTRAAERRAAVRKELGLSPDDVAIVFVGNLTPRKGLDVLLQALANGVAGAWRLFVVGAGEEEPRYRGEVSKLRLDARVKFLGQLPEEAVERMLSGMDLLVLPSFVEGFPYVILEAMACSLPVVATRIYGVPEAVDDGETGVLIPSGDIPALRDALEALVKSPSVRIQMGVNGRRRFEGNFTLARHVGQLETIYREALGENPS